MKFLVACLAFLSISTTANGQVVDELSRRQAFLHYRAGQELLRDERYERAAAEFTSAIELDPLLTQAHYGLGQAYMAVKRYASAVRAFLACRGAYEKLAARRQRNAAELARMAQRLENPETARGGSRFTNRFAVPAEVSLALGSAYFRSERLVDAEREWRAAVETNSMLGEAHNNLAALYARTGRKKEAEEAVRAAERARFRVNPALKDDIRRLP